MIVLYIFKCFQGRSYHRAWEPGPPAQPIGKASAIFTQFFPNLSMFSKFFKTIRIDLIFKIKKILLAIYLKIKFKPFKPF